jgi:hypothetical protein
MVLARLYPLTGQKRKGKVSCSQRKKERSQGLVTFQRTRNANSAKEDYTPVERI